MTQAIRTRRTPDADLNSGTRAYELVMPEEFGHLRKGNHKHRDLAIAIRQMKNMRVGQGIKLKCHGTEREAHNKQKAALAIADRDKIHVRTMLRDGWLFIERLGDK